MRLSGYFVSVATLGFLIIVNVVLINAVDYTRGARTFTGVPLETTLPWAVGWLTVTLVVIARIVYSPVGRRYRSVREDTIAARAIGIKVLPTRLSAFTLGAFFAGVGGSLYGHYLGSFSPASFYMAYTFALVSMLVIGGMQSLTGAVVGVIVVSILSESPAQSRARARFRHPQHSAPLRGGADRPRDHLHSDHDLPPERYHGRSRTVARADRQAYVETNRGLEP